MGLVVRVGIIGLGFIGRTHFTRYQQLENARVVAISDRELERQKGDFLLEGNLDLGLGKLDFSNVDLYSEAEDLIENPFVDVVDVCLPTFLHKPYVEMALEHGKHVICEKPLALNANDAFSMIEKAKENQRKLFVAQVLRYWPEFRYLSDLVKLQNHGQLKYLSMFRRTGDAKWTWDDWILDKNLSGGALDIRIHELDFLYGMLGMPDWLVSQSLDSMNVVNGQFIYENGPKVFVESNRKLPTSLTFEAGFDAIFDEAFLRYRANDKPTLKLFVKSSDEVIFPELAGDPYLEELRDFVNEIEQSKAFNWSSVDEAARSIRVWEHEIESIEKGVIIKPNNTLL